MSQNTMTTPVRQAVCPHDVDSTRPLRVSGVSGTKTSAADPLSPVRHVDMAEPKWIRLVPADPPSLWPVVWSLLGPLGPGPPRWRPPEALAFQRSWTLPQRPTRGPREPTDHLRSDKSQSSTCAVGQKSVPQMISVYSKAYFHCVLVELQ